jgi:hypothetical protein
MWDETLTGQVARIRSSRDEQQTARLALLRSKVLLAAMVAIAAAALAQMAGAETFNEAMIKFKREPVASNFANIGVGVSALLPNRWQPFVNFRTIQGNENLVSYGGTAGLRVGL